MMVQSPLPSHRQSGKRLPCLECPLRPNQRKHAVGKTCGARESHRTYVLRHPGKRHRRQRAAVRGGSAGPPVNAVTLSGSYTAPVVQSNACPGPGCPNRRDSSRGCGRNRRCIYENRSSKQDANQVRSGKSRALHSPELANHHGDSLAYELVGHLLEFRVQIVFFAQVALREGLEVE